MARADCGCSLEQYFSVFTKTDSIKTIKVLQDLLKPKDKRGGAIRFLKTLEAFPPGFRTRRGIPGNRLLDYNDVLQQEGFIEMAHEYICVRGKGLVHWPTRPWENHDKSLQYPRDSYEKNTLAIKKRIRSKRGPAKPQQSIPDSESPASIPPDDLLSSDGSSTTDESVSPSLSSQSTVADQDIVRDAPRDEARPIRFRQECSPDELAEDHYPQPPIPFNVQQQHDEQDNVGVILGRRPSLAPNNPVPPVLPIVSTASTGTQTFDQDGQRPPRDHHAPPPSSMNTNGCSQESGNSAGASQGNRTHPPSSIERVERPQSPPLAHPSNANGERECTIELVVSYDSLPGVNILLEPERDIFSYSLNQLFEGTYWQANFNWLIVFLQAPSTAPGIPLLTYVEYVPTNDEKKFQVVLRRFKQHVESLRFCYNQLNRDAVIEICFEPLVHGHTHGVQFDAWTSYINNHAARR
ncbi:hypothetical protein FHETE_7351 [Fusarium heterosporum]|uniref:Uncharacterized protein n=1 Tax=Fusarium heterosporum TaxID=42747 RepID=A0A8H5WKW5_FUSHE|nr:hypothetical protein FHETE_7351 [Fusarium heterosporum]